MTSITLQQPAYEIVFSEDVAEVRQAADSGAKCLFAKQAFQPGDIIAKFYPEAILSNATYLTIQLDEKEHISILPEYLRYTNHSCAPNIFFDTAALEVKCLKPVAIGEEMTFFYPSSEWDMAQPFDCCCGHKECLGTIQGAAHLSDEVLKSHTLTEFIQQKLKNRSL
jgi:hypothetical protein